MNNKGFTLIELMISLIILAVGFLAIGGMQVTSITTNNGSGILTEATILAQNELEYLKSLPYDDNNLKVGEYPKKKKKHKNDDEFFSVGYTVSALGSLGKTIVVTVTWQDKGQHSVTISTIRTE